MRNFIVIENRSIHVVLMSEELKRCVEDALYRWIMKQMEQGKFRANLRIEIDTPIEVKGLKGRLVGEIFLTEVERSQMPVAVSLKEGRGEGATGTGGEGVGGGEGGEMRLQEVEKLLRSLGV
ncbi:MAG: hypothetical protein ACUVQ5_06680 [Candidatus Methanomethylicaceae archaeon]